MASPYARKDTGHLICPVSTYSLELAAGQLRSRKAAHLLLSVLAVKSSLHRLLLRNCGRVVNILATARVPEWALDIAVLGQAPDCFWLAVLRIPWPRVPSTLQVGRTQQRIPSTLQIDRTTSHGKGYHPLCRKDH